MKESLAFYRLKSVALFLDVAHMQQLVAALLAVFLHHPRHNGIALGALEHCHIVGPVQPVAAFFLALFQSVGLTRAADAAALAGHHLDEVIEGSALVNVLEELLGVGKAVDDRDLELRVADGDRCFLDRRVTAQTEDADLAQGVLALVGQAVAHDRRRSCRR